MRVGIGYDIHRLVTNRKLFLGGLQIPYFRGLISHSDGDVVLHALCDALLGAIGEGDMGRHFPSSDPQYSEIASSVLVERVILKVKEKGLRVASMDGVILAEKPRLAESLPAMAQNVARLLRVPAAMVNLKAKTADTLDAVGKGEGISAQVIVMLEPGAMPEPAPPPAPPAPPSPAGEPPEAEIAE